MPPNPLPGMQQSFFSQSVGGQGAAYARLTLQTANTVSEKIAQTIFLLIGAGLVSRAYFLSILGSLLKNVVYSLICFSNSRIPTGLEVGFKLHSWNKNEDTCRFSTGCAAGQVGIFVLVVLPQK